MSPKPSSSIDVARILGLDCHQLRSEPLHLYCVQFLTPPKDFGINILLTRREIASQGIPLSERVGSSYAKALLGLYCAQTLISNAVIVRPFRIPFSQPSFDRDVPSPAPS
jgi:hypothetical protein